MSISYLISYDVLVSITAASIVLLLIWFILGVRSSNNKNKDHDKELFKQPLPEEDCPICFLRLPYLGSGSRYYACCGKVICCGCVHAPVYDDQGNEIDDQKCPFCRSLRTSSDEELNEMEKKRIEADDDIALFNIGVYYRDGRYGFPQDYTKALELWHRAGELGHAAAYRNIGVAYETGRGVEVDKKKSEYYHELAAIKGDTGARFSLGCHEACAGNTERAIKHFMIAARSGHSGSLKDIQQFYGYGFVTKEDYTVALQLYQTYLGEIKSSQRDKAAAANEEYRYY